MVHCSVTENGFSVKNESDMNADEAVKDFDRVHYFQGTTKALLDAVNVDGVDIRAYFPWSELIFRLGWFDSPYLTLRFRFPG